MNDDKALQIFTELANAAVQRGLFQDVKSVVSLHEAIDYLEKRLSIAKTDTSKPESSL